MGVLQGCTPRPEVLKGDLDDAIFAADFGHLIAGEGAAPKVYSDPGIFFQNTHPAKQLVKVVQAVFGRLADPKEVGATIRLSTGFGGGKTHTLMALWHLSNHIGEPGMGSDLLPAAGRPNKVTVVAIDASKAGNPVFSQHGKISVKSLWGELAYRLGGEKGLKVIADADDPARQPEETRFASLFPDGPVLILLDELVVYMAGLSSQAQGNLLSFIGKLTSISGSRPQTVLVVTDPADQRAYAKEAAKVGDALTAAAVKLDDLLGRKMTDFDPIGDETAQVITRRLFERVDAVAAQSASANFHSLYERVGHDSPGLVPPSSIGADYAKKVVECYPFHPRLMATAQGHLQGIQSFNKSRGTLRLFARILRGVWEHAEDLEIITAGDVDWSSDRIQADLLQRLNRDNFKAAVNADLEKHARELDNGKHRGIHTRVASALLLESLPLDPNSGLDPAETTLAVLRPEEAGPEPSEALDHLIGVCWHTYPMAGGRGWQFRYEPNIIKQIEERMTQIDREDAKSRVFTEAQSYFGGMAFKLRSWPASASQVPESGDLQLALCDSEKLAKSVCAYSDDSNPSAPIPRRYQNAILAVTSSVAAFDAAVERAQRLLAAEAIERDNRQGDSGRLVRDQLSRVKPDMLKQFRIQTCRAFDRIVLPGGTVYSLDEQFQVPEEQLLQKPQGQACLRRFLDVKSLIYQPGEALDVDLFLRDILPGAISIPNDPEAYTAKAVHERFLAAPNLRLIPNGDIARQTLLKAVASGKVILKMADERVFDSKGAVEGPEGRRRRTTNTLGTSLALDDTVRIAVSGTGTATQWTQIDPETPGVGDSPGGGPGLPPPPPPPSRATAQTWEKAVDLAGARPLLDLSLTVTNPQDASALLPLVQPLGAERLSLSVTVSGTLKEGGALSFSVSDLKPNHPTKPLAIAQTLFNAVGDGSQYETVLALHFGTQGRAGMESALKELSEQSPEGVRPRATFDKPSGSSK